MRKRIAAGNWKMNLNAKEAEALVSETLTLCSTEYNGDGLAIFAPSFPFLSQVSALIGDKERFSLSAQNIHQEENGAYTGEVSASMVKSIGASHVILGHSERRQYFGETNGLLAQKVNKALEHGLSVIYCMGETLEQRQAEQILEVVGSQIKEGLFHLDSTAFANVILAYEPIWAIGTGVTASPEQAQEVHAFIRSIIAEKYGDVVAGDTTILYGGSVKPGNAEELFSQPDIDGGLVGGASMKARDFTDIIKAL